MAEFEPLTLLSGLAAVTSRIGIAGTASTSYSEPYNPARQFSSLDHLSGGRAAWNVVTSSAPIAALNFNRAAQEDHQLRYEILSVDPGVDLRELPLDEPIPPERLPQSSNRTKSYFDNMVAVMREEKLTVRQLYLACCASRGGMNAIAGSPSTIADRMEAWFRSGAADGFMVRVPYLPGGLEDFTTSVVPELQRRGLFRIEYEGCTLRDHLGLARPASRYATD